MVSIFIALALSTAVVGPALAQDVAVPGTAAKMMAKKDSAKADYWASRDLSSVLTKVVTIKLR